MIQKTIRVPSILYRELYVAGGDQLIAVYALLKYAKSKNSSFSGFKSYTSKNNKLVGGFGVIRKNTKLSLSVIQKFVPMLVELKICHFEKDGSFVMLGNNRVKKMFSPKKGEVKLVPILIGKNFIDTQYNSSFVRLHSEHRKQGTMISVKETRRHLIKQFLRLKREKDAYMPYGKAKRAEKLIKKYGKNIEIVKVRLMSNSGFAFLKHEVSNKPALGAYYKRKFIEKGMVTAKRRFRKLDKMSFGQYQKMKDFHPTPEKLTYMKGRAWLRLTSSFTIFSPIITTNSSTTLRKIPKENSKLQ